MIKLSIDLGIAKLSKLSIDGTRVLADKAYATGANLTAAESRKLEVIGGLAEPHLDHNPALRDDLTPQV